MGESFLNTGKCVECEAGNQYLLTIPDWDLTFLTCKQCPWEAECFGGSKIFPKKNYWRLNFTSTEFHECFWPESCLGEDDPNSTYYSGRCEEGYERYLCSTCSLGYSWSSNFACRKCPNIIVNLIFLLVFILILVGIMSVIVWATIKSSKSRKSNIGVYIKIGMNHI